jgi:hypothetical protein
MVYKRGYGLISTEMKIFYMLECLHIEFDRQNLQKQHMKNLEVGFNKARTHTNPCHTVVFSVTASFDAFHGHQYNTYVLLAQT